MEVSVRELKAQLSKYLRQVAAGEEVVVTSHGKPVARLASLNPPPKTPEERQAQALARLVALPWIRPGRGGRLRGSDRPMPEGDAGSTSAEIVEWLRS